MSKRYIPPRKRAALTAILAAQREHEHLHTGLSKTIDIFGIIEAAGIWLMFQPLKSLYGILYPAGNSIGILINSQHPASLQRYTAAHEYGHYVLGHLYSFDNQAHIESVDRTQSDPKELEAQTFAAYFLMPLQLVNTVLRQMNLPRQPGTLTPRQAYLLSLELGASYRATVHHLANLKKITRSNEAELLDQQPREIKTAVGRGARPQNTRADIWELGERDSGKSLQPRIEDELYVSLPEIPSTGYIWTIDPADSVVDLSSNQQVKEGHNKSLALIAEDFEGGERGADQAGYGGAGVRHFLLRVLEPGRCKLRLVKRRPWSQSSPLEVFEVELQIPARPTGDKASGLSQRQQSLLVGAA